MKVKEFFIKYKKQIIITMVLIIILVFAYKKANSNSILKANSKMKQKEDFENLFKIYFKDVEQAKNMNDASFNKSFDLVYGKIDSLTDTDKVIAYSILNLVNDSYGKLILYKTKFSNLTVHELNYKKEQTIKEFNESYKSLSNELGNSNVDRVFRYMIQNNIIKKIEEV